MKDMAECTGKYRLSTSENFEDFMKVLGVGLITRKLGNKASPTITITKDEDEFSFKQESFKTSEFKFKVGADRIESSYILRWIWISLTASWTSRPPILHCIVLYLKDKSRKSTKKQ